MSAEESRHVCDTMFAYLGLRAAINRINFDAQGMRRHQLAFLSRRLAGYDARTRDIAYLVGAERILGDTALAAIDAQHAMMDASTRRDLERALAQDTLEGDLGAAVDTVHQLYSRA